MKWKCQHGNSIDANLLKYAEFIDSMKFVDYSLSDKLPPLRLGELKASDRTAR